MGHNKVICSVKQVEYLDIRKAMTKGARTLEELKEMTGLCGACEGCVADIPAILSSVCGCAGASLEEVLHAVKAGHVTVEAVGAVTGAGTHCGRCKGLIQNVIDLGR